MEIMMIMVSACREQQVPGFLYSIWWGVGGGGGGGVLEGEITFVLLNYDNQI